MFRTIILLLPPLLLAILELWHPTGFKSHVYQSLEPKSDWWFYLHMIQLPLFGLMGVAGYFLTSNITNNLLKYISTLGFWLFVVFYASFDSVGGISIGAILRDANNLPPSDQEVISGVVQRLYNHSLVGGSHSVISEIASFAWLVGMVPTIILLIKEKAPVISILAFSISAISLWWSHAYPYGPIAFSAFFIGSLFLLLWEKRVITQQKDVN